MGEKIVVERIYTDKNPQEAMGGGSKGGRDATNAPPRCPKRDAAVLIATQQLLNAMRVWGATWRATSLQRPWGRPLMGSMRGWHGMRMARRWAGESSRCEDPAPTGGMAGRRLRGMPHRPSFAPMGGSTGMANGRITTPRRWKNRRVPIGGRLEVHITTRRAASLRPPRNGRIGFKPPYSKREPQRKARMDSTFWGDFPFLRVNRFQSRNFISRRT